MTTLHIENTVRDYATWQEAFDKFERFRADNGVRSYRICQQASDPNEITIDLEFGSPEEAEAFVPKLQQIWSTPQSKEQLVAHGAPTLMEVVRLRDLEPSAS
jgi:ribosomal protein L35AE/L33A